MRNPYTVFESTRSFFTNTIQPLKLQDRGLYRDHRLRNNYEVFLLASLYPDHDGIRYPDFNGYHLSFLLRFDLPVPECFSGRYGHLLYPGTLPAGWTVVHNNIDLFGG